MALQTKTMVYDFFQMYFSGCIFNMLRVYLLYFKGIFYN